MIWYLVTVAVVVTVDLITKYTIPGLLNPGISWGLGADISWLWWVIVALSAGLAVTVTVLVVLKRPRRWLGLGAGLFIGGVLGNMIDRLITGGAVHDFINFYFFQNNLADIAICVGAVIVGVRLAVR